MPHFTPHNTFPTNHETDLPAAHFLDTDLQPWHDRMTDVISQRAAIIALRGAGGATGIEPAKAEKMVTIMEGHIAELAVDGCPVVLISDGDNDDRQYPDVGGVFGALADTFAYNPLVLPMAVQTYNWYKPKAPGAALSSVRRNPYETYIFNKDMADIGEHLSGRAQAHSALSQSDQLVNYPRYQQVILGAAGSATFNQLRDLSNRAARRSEGAEPVPVSVLAAHNDPAVKDKLEKKLGHPDPAKNEITLKKLAWHARAPYGALCTADGEFALDPADYPGLSFSFRKV